MRCGRSPCPGQASAESASAGTLRPCLSLDRPVCSASGSRIITQRADFAIQCVPSLARAAGRPPTSCWTLTRSASSSSRGPSAHTRGKLDGVRACRLRTWALGSPGRSRWLLRPVLCSGGDNTQQGLAPCSSHLLSSCSARPGLASRLLGAHDLGSRAGRALRLPSEVPGDAGQGLVGRGTCSTVGGGRPSLLTLPTQGLLCLVKNQAARTWR